MKHGNITKRVLVTSGPTRAYFDRVRYIANSSSGALGSRIVEELVNRGMPVVHVYGFGSETSSVEDGCLLESIQVITVDDLMNSIRTIAERGDIAAVVHAMAVLDYIPESAYDGKKPSGDNFWDIRLVKTPKVIGLIRKLMPDAYIVGFKLEGGISEDELVNRAGTLLERYGLDLVAANLIERVGEKLHEALFVGPGKKVLAAVSSKRDIAVKLADYIAERYK